MGDIACVPTPASPATTLLASHAEERTRAAVDTAYADSPDEGDARATEAA